MKGSLQCGECCDAGRQSRLLYSQNTGNGGAYEYFICTAKQRRICSLPAIPIAQIEAQLQKVVDREQMRPTDIDAIRDAVSSRLEEMQAADRELKDALRRQLKKLEAQEDRLLDLASDSAMPVERIRGRLQETALKKAAANEQLAVTEDRLRYGVDAALAYLDPLRDPGKLYRRAPGSARRELLSAFFERVLVYVEEDDIVVVTERSHANTAVHDAAAALEPAAPTARKIPRGNARDFDAVRPGSSRLFTV